MPHRKMHIENTKRKGEEMNGYCVVCRRSVKIREGKKVKFKNGKKAIKGRCSSCGTKIFRIVGDK